MPKRNKKAARPRARRARGKRADAFRRRWLMDYAKDAVATDIAAADEIERLRSINTVTGADKLDPLLCFRQLLNQLDPDPDREGLQETPGRMAEAWQHWTQGYRVNTADLLKTFKDGSEDYDEMVFVGNVPFYSMCEHHLAPFFGLAHVGYIPGKNGVVGLSKIPRLVDAFAQRLSVQERITTQVADTMFSVLKPRGVGVLLQARHMCVESRGVAKAGTITTTSAVRGMFKSKPDVKSEFLRLIALQKGASLV